MEKYFHKKEKYHISCQRKKMFALEKNFSHLFAFKIHLYLFVFIQFSQLFEGFFIKIY